MVWCDAVRCVAMFTMLTLWYVPCTTFPSPDITANVVTGAAPSSVSKPVLSHCSHSHTYVTHHITQHQHRYHTTTHVLHPIDIISERGWEEQRHRCWGAVCVMWRGGLEECCVTDVAERCWLHETGVNLSPGPMLSSVCAIVFPRVLHPHFLFVVYISCLF